MSFKKREEYRFQLIKKSIYFVNYLFTFQSVFPGIRSKSLADYARVAIFNRSNSNSPANSSTVPQTDEIVKLQTHRLVGPWRINVKAANYNGISPLEFNG